MVSLEMDQNIQTQFGQQVLPTLVNGKLEGRNVAVIETTPNHSSGGLISSLKMAGANIQTVTVFSGVDTSEIPALLKRLNWPEMDEKKLTARVGEEIARAILTGDTNNLNILAREGVVKTGGQYGRPVDDVVILGGSPDRDMIKTTSLDYSIIDHFRSGKVNVFGVEESSVAYSYMKDYQKKDITTVDNIDTIPGQVSLVYAMSGRPGRYGIKSTARNLLPDLGSEVPAYAR